MSAEAATLEDLSFDVTTDLMEEDTDACDANEELETGPRINYMTAMTTRQLAAELGKIHQYPSWKIPS